MPKIHFIVSWKSGAYRVYFSVNSLKKEGAMPKYILKRAIMSLITAFLVATLTFFVMNMVPGGPFLSEKAVTPQAQAAMEAKYGLDKPLFKQ